MASPAQTLAFRPRLQAPDDCVRPTRAEIDLGAIAANLGVVRQAAGEAELLAVVKADAYGHGVVPVAARLEAEGVSGFGVALAEEGLELRDAGIEGRIVVLNGVYGGAHADVLQAGLTPVVYDIAELEAFQRAARGRPFDVHLKIDTGMARLGVPADELERFLEQTWRCPGMRIEGVLTHLAAADTDDELTAAQLARFEEAIATLQRYGHAPRVVHAANSAATFRHPRARYDMVRPGLALYGYEPAPEVASELQPSMRLRSEIIALRDLPANAPVGYHGTFRTERPSRIATIPVGYGDGLMRAHSNRGEVLIGGRRCPVVGAVSMDLTAIDVTELEHVAVGDEVVLLGAQGDASIGADELARAAHTIPYEVLTNVSRRVPRFYR